MKVQTFALDFGNRGLFPEALIASAREEIATAVEKAGFGMTEAQRVVFYQTMDLIAGHLQAICEEGLENV